MVGSDRRMSLQFHLQPALAAGSFVVPVAKAARLRAVYGEDVAAGVGYHVAVHPVGYRQVGAPVRGLRYPLTRPAGHVISVRPVSDGTLFAVAHDQGDAPPLAAGTGVGGEMEVLWGVHNDVLGIGCGGFAVQPDGAGWVLRSLAKFCSPLRAAFWSVVMKTNSLRVAVDVGGDGVKR